MTAAGTTFVPLDLVEIGCSVWAHDPEKTDADTRDIRGGVVVAIGTGTSRKTGETGLRLFTTATPWRDTVRFAEIVADDVEQAEPPNVAAIRRLIRHAAGVVTKSKRAGSDVARCVALQAQLMEVL